MSADCRTTIKELQHYSQEYIKHIFHTVEYGDFYHLMLFIYFKNISGRERKPLTCL